jgi:cysteine desulfurase/selenocysteine lyase
VTTPAVRPQPGATPQAAIPAPPAPPAAALDSARIRADFPALAQEVHGKPLVYLDNAATALKPQAVIDAVVRIYTRDCANVHRGVHTLSQRATDSYEGARDKLQRFVNAPAREEIVFTRGTTDAINLVAQSWARPRLRPGDQILITGLEHHANIVPWQMLREQTGAELVVVPIREDGDVRVEDVEQRLTERTRLVAVAHASNALGTILPVREIAALAHARGARVLVDGAQAAPHLPVDVRSLGCDFYTLSAHKIYGPSGTGILWAPRALLDEMPPIQGGGDMIRSVTFERTTYADVPHKFEAGTPGIASVVGMGAAVDYLSAFDWGAIRAHEQELMEYAAQRLREVPGVRLYGTAPHKIGVLSFTMASAHPHDIGTIVDAHGVAIRTGHHCAQPVMERFGIPATARASLGLYNTREDVDALIRALQHVQEMFG